MAAVGVGGCAVDAEGVGGCAVVGEGAGGCAVAGEGAGDRAVSAVVVGDRAVAAVGVGDRAVATGPGFEITSEMDSNLEYFNIFKDSDCDIAISIDQAVTMLLPVDLRARLVGDQGIDVVRDEGAGLKLDN